MATLGEDKSVKRRRVVGHGKCYKWLVCVLIGFGRVNEIRQVGHQLRQTVYRFLRQGLDHTRLASQPVSYVILMRVFSYDIIDSNQPTLARQIIEIYPQRFEKMGWG